MICRTHRLLLRARRMAPDVRIEEVDTIIARPLKIAM
jgi:hypothetical protein